MQVKIEIFQAIYEHCVKLNEIPLETLNGLFEIKLHKRLQSHQWASGMLKYELIGSQKITHFYK